MCVDACGNYDKFNKRCGNDFSLCDNIYKKPVIFFVLSIHKRIDDYKRESEPHPIHAIPYRHENYLKEHVNPPVNNLLNLRDNHPGVAKFIFGLDACSQEIGCRPEVFAPAFRRVRHKNVSPRVLSDGIYLPPLRVTYHVGEDFNDIIDGLRAIDEAIRFLEMRSADRLGHALALGITPENFYEGKGNKIFISRQDLLDNAVWFNMMLRRCGIHLPILLYELELIYREQFASIYEGTVPLGFAPSIEQYHESWLLRGDDPDYYRDIDAVTDDVKFTQRLNRMRCHKNNIHSDLQYEAETSRIREENRTARFLNFKYHYDIHVREKGAVMVEWNVTPSYIGAVSLLQKKIQDEIAWLGIGIECNPTSNYLIGTFKDYKKHPIFVFNNDGLDEGKDSALLHVSINTDDQGVFDTNLENEYSLITCALKSMISEDGSKKYKPHNIYRYIDNIRQMGLEQSFKLLDRDLSGRKVD
jgi:hypothetical protein